MGSANKCLKWLFIVFNALFALTGIVFVGLAHFSGIAAEMKNEVGNFWTLSLFGAIVASISILGVYGAYKEKGWALITFSVLVSIGTVICLIGGVQNISDRAQLSGKFEEFFERDDVDTLLQHIQEKFNLECCGTRIGYQEWSSQIPESCICPTSYQGTEKCQKTNARRFTGSSRYWGFYQTEVYSETCHSLIVRLFNMMMDAMTGIFFGLSIAGLIGVIMAINITCRIKKQRTTMPVSIYECSKPPAYEELYTMKFMPEQA
ncbi:tetraspanin-8-like [Sardina pilchardus]|uniref:tetraspanin-8-like n=1 Tax=Sardina pilchardus TaxID=27697 RepID=UPI002E16480A